MLVSLKYPIEKFKDLQDENLVIPKFSSDQIKIVICELHPGVGWLTEGEGVYFGCTRCGEEYMLEVWIMEKPFFSLKIIAKEDVVIEIAKKINLTAIDVQTGKIITIQIF